MLSTLIGVIGAISITLGVTQYMYQRFDMNSILIEIFFYMAVAALIFGPYVTFIQPYLHKNTSFLFNVLGLVFLPCLIYLSAFFHPENHEGIYELNTLIGFLTGGLSIVVAKLHGSQFGRLWHSRCIFWIQ